VQYTYRTAEELYTVEVQNGPDGWSVTLDAEQPVVGTRTLGDGQWLLRSGGRQVRAWVAARGDERFVFIDGHALRLRLPDPDTDAEEGAGDGGPNIIAIMPGKVVRVLVAPGAEVIAGDPVLVMESMKMETELAAPISGCVAVVHVVEGQTVAQNDPLIDVEPTTGG